MQQRPPDAVWPIDGTSDGHIGDVTLADFAQKFANISWTLTDKDYSAINGGVGEVVSHFSGKTWTGAAEEIRASDFAIYMAWPDREGATYLALHETAHVTALGLQMNSMLFICPPTWAATRGVMPIRRCGPTIRRSRTRSPRQSPKR